MKLPAIATAHLRSRTGAKGSKLQRRYAERLELLRRAGEVLWFAEEAVTLTLAPGTRFTVDFAVVVKSGALEMHETKGFMREAARVRINVAASLYPFKFILVRDDGRQGFTYETVGGADCRAKERGNA